MKVKLIEPVQKKYKGKYQEIYDTIPKINENRGLEITPEPEQSCRAIASAMRTYLYNHKISKKYYVFRQDGKVYIQLKE